MASESLYNYTIGFDTSGVKELEQEIKRNEKELDRYEQKIKDLEGVMDTLTRAGGVGSDSYRETAKELETARKEADKYKKSIEQLKNTSQHSFAQMQQSFTSLMRTIGLFAVVRGTIQKSLDFYEQAEQLDFLAQKTGIAAERLQELSFVSARYGGTVEGTVSSVENIRTNKEEYQKAGIRIEQDPSKTLENVAKKMQTLKSDAQKWQLADSLSLDEATTRALIEGVDKYNESLQKGAKYKLYTKEDIQRMREYRQIQQDIRMNMASLSTIIYKVLLPSIRAIGQILEKFTSWLNNHQGAVKIALTTAGILALAGAFSYLAGEMATVLKWGRFLTRAFFSWILPLMVIIALIQSLIVFLEGGDSFLGRLWEKWGYDLDMIRNGFEIWAEKLKMIWNNLLAYFDKNRLHIDDPFDPKKVNDYHGKPLTADESKKLVDKVSQRSGTRDVLKYGKNYMGQIFAHPANSVPTGAVSNYYGTQSQNSVIKKNTKNFASNRTLNVGSININTQASDPKAVAKEIGSTLDSLDNGQIG